MRPGKLVTLNLFGMQKNISVLQYCFSFIICRINELQPVCHPGLHCPAKLHTRAVRRKKEHLKAISRLNIKEKLTPLISTVSIPQGKFGNMLRGEIPVIVVSCWDAAVPVSVAPCVGPRTNHPAMKVDFTHVV